MECECDASTTMSVRDLRATNERGGLTGGRGGGDCMEYGENSSVRETWWWLGCGCGGGGEIDRILGLSGTSGT